MYQLVGLHGIGPWEFAQLAQLDGAQNRAYRVLSLGEAVVGASHQSSGPSGAVGVSATISLVGMEDIKLHNQPQRRIDRARSVGIPHPSAFVALIEVIYSDFINYMEYMPINWNCEINSAFSPSSLRDSPHSLAYNVASLDLCGWVASGENGDTILA